MNKTTTSAAGALLGLVLIAGCTGGSTTPSSTAPEPTSASSASTPTASPTEASTTPPATTPPATVPAETASPDEPETSSRGNLIKRVGDPAGYGDSLEDLAFEFKVTDITTDFKCTSPYADEPERGHFIAFDFEVRTAPDMVEQLEEAGSVGMTSISLHSSEFRLIDSEGFTLQEAASSASYMCLKSTDDYLPSAFGADERARGKIIFDSPTEHGVVVLGSNGSVNGWEWEF